MTDSITPESIVLEPAETGPAPATVATEEKKPDDKAPEQKLSRRESIEASLKKIEAGGDDDPAPEAKEPAKVEARAEKPVAPVAAKDEAVKPPLQAEDDKASSEDDKSPPPARIAEEAKKFWRSTPRAMKAEFARLEGEIGRMTQEGGEASRVYSEVRQYDEMARKAGTNVGAAMERYVKFDQQIMQDFGKGFRAIADEQKRAPQEVITSVLRAYGVTPQQFAQAVAQNPQAFAPRPSLQADPAIQQLMQSQQQMNEWMKKQDEASEKAEKEKAYKASYAEKSKVLESWGADKPDLAQREGAIAEILQSGIIEKIHGKGLTDLQRLDAAYRMSGGAGPSVPQQQQQTAPAPGQAAPPPVEGNLSITGAPGSGKDPSPTRAKSKSRRETIEAAMAKLAS